MIRLFLLCPAALLLLAIEPSAFAQVPVNIEIRYRNAELEQNFGSFYEATARRWESILPAWIDGRDESGNPIFESIIINANSQPLSPGLFGFSNISLTDSDGTYLLSGAGNVVINEAVLTDDLDPQFFLDVLTHEFAHVLGFGTLWDNPQNGAAPYVDGTGQFTGPNALAQYRREFNPNADYVPVELGGTSATRDGHWDEALPITGDDTVLDPDGLTVIDPSNANFGGSRSQALLSGTFTPGSFLTNTTGGAFQDLGFVVDFNAIQGRIAGDYNLDEVVSVADFVSFRDTAGQADGGFITDGNFDGQVDVADFELFVANFNTAELSNAQTAIAIPEPASAILLTLTTILLASGRPSPSSGG